MSFLRGGDVFAEYNTPATARDLGTISSGVTVNNIGPLTEDAPAQYFKFKLPTTYSAQLVTIYTDVFEPFNSKVELMDSEERLINSDDNSGPGLDANLTMTIGTGIYYIKVSAVSPGQLNLLDGNSYGLRVKILGRSGGDVGANSFATAIPYATALNGPWRLSVGENISTGDDDYYSYHVGKRAMVELKVKGSALTTGTLYDSNQVKIAQNSHSRESQGITRVAAILEQGKYYFRVQGFTSTTNGPYELTISESPPVCATGALVPGHDTTSYEWIQRAPIGIWGNNTGNNGGFKLAEAGWSANLIPLGNTIITLVPGFYGSSSYLENWAIWIDTNKDREFSDSERIYSGQSSSTIYAPVNIPYFTGDTIMRIAMRWDKAPSACGHVPWGEVEDYLVKVQ